MMLHSLRNWIDNQSARLALLSPVRGGVFDFFLGALVPLAMPPIGAWPVLFFIFPALLLRLQRIRRWQNVALTAWLFGFGQFFIGLYWIGFAFLVEPDLFLWALPFAVTLLPAGLAVFPMLAALVWFRLFSDQPRFAVRALGLVLCLVLVSWLRSNILTGLPWNLYGMSALSWLPLAQSARLWGVHGLSLLMLSVAMLPLFIRHERKLAALLFLGFLLAVLDGYTRLNSHEPETTDSVMVRIVQPSIPQKEKWIPENRLGIIRTHLELTGQPADVPIDVVVWPETALPALLYRDVWLREQITDILPDGAYLITGGLRRELLAKALDTKSGGAGDAPSETSVSENKKPWRSFNSVFVISPEGNVEDFYDKHHLVPFGEYLPQQKFLEFLGLQQLTRLRGGFTAGDGPRSLALGGLGKSFSPLICYEVIFPGRVVAEARPDVLITVTNDGWFGKSAGPWQHLEMARMRTIEEGLPIIRSANTGISAVFDALGRQQALMPLMQRGVLDVPLPPAVHETTYARYGDLIFFLMLFAVVGFIFKLPRPEI